MTEANSSHIPAQSALDSPAQISSPVARGGLRLPRATYRVQFRNGMTFDRAAGIVPHLKKLGIPFEECKNSFSATRFVGWYNGHPEDLDLNPDMQI